jgi:hypothetical protein
MQSCKNKPDRAHIRRILHISLVYNRSSLIVKFRRFIHFALHKRIIIQLYLVHINRLSHINNYI